MKTIDVIQGSSNRNQNLRLLMLIVIVGTLPFYCLGIMIIGSAPAANVAPTATAAQLSDATFTPLSGGQAGWAGATISPVRIPTVTPLSALQPTPRQFIPPTLISVSPTLVASSPTALKASPTRRFSVGGPADRDGDGSPDSADDCPEEYGFAENAGCPYPDDPDRDGIRAEADRCPNEFAPGTRNGCRDFDDDGLDTSQDACPAAAGPSSNRGCPLDGTADDG